MRWLKTYGIELDLIAERFGYSKACVQRHTASAPRPEALVRQADRPGESRFRSRVSDVPLLAAFVSVR